MLWISLDIFGYLWIFVVFPSFFFSLSLSLFLCLSVVFVCFECKTMIVVVSGRQPDHLMKHPNQSCIQLHSWITIVCQRVAQGSCSTLSPAIAPSVGMQHPLNIGSQTNGRSAFLWHATPSTSDPWGARSERRAPKTRLPVLWLKAGSFQRLGPSLHDLRDLLPETLLSGRCLDWRKLPVLVLVEPARKSCQSILANGASMSVDRFHYLTNGRGSKIGTPNGTLVNGNMD